MPDLQAIVQAADPLEEATRQFNEASRNLIEIMQINSPELIKGARPMSASIMLDNGFALTVHQSLTADGERMRVKKQ